MKMVDEDDISKLRSHIPGNRALRQKQFCLREAAKYHKRGDKKRAENAESWAKHFQAQHDEYENSDTLIHYAAVPEGVCDRKDSKADERTERVGLRGATITHTASASHLENVTCLRCRRWARQNPRRTWRCEHDVLLTEKCSECAAEHEQFINSVVSEARRAKECAHG